MKFNLKEPHGVVYGHDFARYEQGGKLFDAQFRPLEAEKPVEEKPKTSRLLSNKAEAASAFLIQILKENPLAKATIYREAEANNQNWDDVKNAAVALNIAKFQKNSLEMWRLPENVGT